VISRAVFLRATGTASCWYCQHEQHAACSSQTCNCFPCHGPTYVPWAYLAEYLAARDAQKSVDMDIDHDMVKAS
jgi:hypothetical protein